MAFFHHGSRRRKTRHAGRGTGMDLHGIVASELAQADARAEWPPVEGATECRFLLRFSSYGGHAAEPLMTANDTLMRES